MDGASPVLERVGDQFRGEESGGFYDVAGQTSTGLNYRTAGVPHPLSGALDDDV